MSYCTRTDVKQRLKLDETETAWDTEIDGYVFAGYEWINRKLQAYTYTPLDPVPEVIKGANADYAAGIFRENRAPPGEENTFTKRAEKRLDEYITDEFLKQGADKVKQ